MYTLQPDFSKVFTNPDCLKVLRDKLECSFGLIQILLGDFLSDREYEEIKITTNFYKQNDLLLEILKEKSNQELNAFLEALRKTKQGHLATYIVQEGQSNFV